jgi:hypothetical protein
MFRFRSSRSGVAPQTPRHPCVEALEARALMSLTVPPGYVPPAVPPYLPRVTFPQVTLEKGVLTITGTGGDDQISVSEERRVSRGRPTRPAARFRNFPGGAYPVRLNPLGEARLRGPGVRRGPSIIRVYGVLGSYTVRASRVRSIVIVADAGNDRVTIAVGRERVSADVQGGAGDDVLVRACGDNSLPAMTGGPGNDQFQSDAAQVTDLEPGETLMPRDCG